MTPKERVQMVLDRKIPDRPPICLHNFLMACKEAAVPLERYLREPGMMARAHLDALERYQHDCVLLDLDTTLLAEAMGAEVDSTPGEPGHVAAPAIADICDVGQLKVADPYKDGRLPQLLEGIHEIAGAIGETVSIRGNCDQGPFSLSCLLRGNEAFLMDIMEDEETAAIEDLLEVSYQSHLAVHLAVKEAGAHFTSLGDSFCGPDVISPGMFRRFSKPYEERLVRELAQHDIFTVIHICGDTSLILEDFESYGFCGFELDYKTDMERAKATVGQNHVLFGNIDPSGVLARARPSEVEAKTRALVDCWSEGGLFVLNAGCAIPASTPEENLRAMLRVVAEKS